MRIGNNIIGTPGKGKQGGVKHAGVGKPIKPYAQIELDPETGEMEIRSNAIPITGALMANALEAKFLGLLARQAEMQAQALTAQAEANAAGASDLPVQ